MMTEDDLQDAINAEAEEKFDRQWKRQPEDQAARIAYQALQRTTEFRDFRNAMIKLYKKEITHNILANMQGLANIARKAGEE